MSEARNHHFLSQCYLKGFTRDGTKDSQLFAMDVANGSTFSTVPRNVGAQRDFNRIEGHGPGKIEQELSAFEAEVDVALGRVRQRGSIDDRDDWNAVLNLMALFAVRNPRARDQVNEFNDDLWRKVLDVALATPERWELQLRKMKDAGDVPADTKVTYEQMKEFHDRGEYDIVTPRDTHVAREFELQDTVLQLMGNRSWRLCLADSGTGGFVTGDHPVCLMHGDGKQASLQRPLGHGTAGSTVLFPLSGRLIAVGTFGGSARSTKLSPFQVAYMNGVTCGHAQRQVYATDDAFRVLLGGYKEPVTSSKLSRYLAEKSQES